jgi:hypothetical protein
MRQIRTVTGGLALLAACTLAGCTRTTTPAPKGETKGTSTASKDARKAKAEHAAHGAGPHGGTVADWGGGKYHIEFTVDHAKQEAVVYILGSDEKTPVPVKAKEGQLLLSIKEPAFQVTLKAEPQKGDPEGKASRFTGKHEKLGKEQEFAGTISGEVNGTPYAGDFKEEPEAPTDNQGKK